ncbi:hypothetical protein FHX42_001667 [Saccharopolyspora lacisalsi]|uniref:Uncharacterized protein n=1 Tax=Halosaccharopolyspora lacisalsi TaxID=1000566 RepID=A0A839DTS2_9PSEU|nr:hypothetical protein [Halosaccharopolyspora lacisalsi]
MARSSSSRVIGPMNSVSSLFGAPGSERGLEATFLIRCCSASATVCEVVLGLPGRFRAWQVPREIPWMAAVGVGAGGRVRWVTGSGTSASCCRERP